MKHRFSRVTNFTPTWNGNDTLPDADQLKTVIKPLVNDDLLLLMDALGSMKPQQPGVPTDAADLAKIVKEAGHILPKYVEVSNLEDDNGPVTVVDITTYPTYLGLATELLMKCAEVSMPSENAEKNSAQPPV
jgi:hypothetical protein